eukprot:41226_1
MNQFFWIGIGFMIAYRSVAALLGMVVGYSMCADADHGCCGRFLGMIGGFLSGLLELNIFFAIYFDKTDSDQSKTEGSGIRQKVSQLMEGVLESLPEVIMQSVFVMRAVNDER